MKLSTKIILPIILISALLILLSGCAPTTPSPGATTTTGGTITGIFETPEACCMGNRDHTEGWVPLVNATVSVIDVKGVTHTTKTDSDGKYWLTDVAPGIYYVITACCECEDGEGVYKDVVEEELKEGDTYDAGIADCESSALGLMVDFLLSGDVFEAEDCNCYCNCFDEESQIYASLVYTGVKLRAAAINLQSIPSKPLDAIRANADFQAFLPELCDLLEACCVEPGVTPVPPPPIPPPGKYNLYLKADPWDGAKSLTGAGVKNPGEVVGVNTEANPCYEFTGWTVDVGSSANVSGDLGTPPLSVIMNENMTLTAWFECPPCYELLDIDISGPLVETINSHGLTKSEPPDVTICVPGCATINSVTVNSGCEEEGSPFPLVLTPPYDPSVLDFDYNETNISFDYETGKVCFIGEETLLPYIATILVTYTNPCGDPVATGTVEVEFEDCSCIAPTVEADGPYTETVCPGAAATIVFDSTVTSGTGPFIYAWTFGDGDTSADADPSHEYPTGAKVYDVTLVVTNDCGESTYNTTVTITEYPLPTADAGPDQSVEVCPQANASINLVGSGTGTPTLSYSWDYDNGGSTVDSTEQNPLGVTFGVGSYTVTLTVTDGCGDTETDTMTVTVTNAPVANLLLDAVYHCKEQNPCHGQDKLFWYENCGSAYGCECVDWRDREYLEKCCCIEWQRWHKRDWVTVNVKVSGGELANAKIVLNYDDTKLKLWDPDSSELEGGQGQIDPSPALNVISGTFTPPYTDASGKLTINDVDCAGTGTRTVLSIIFMKTGTRSWDPVGNDWSDSTWISFADLEIELQSSSGGLICLDGSTGVEIVGDGTMITECPYWCNE